MNATVTISDHPLVAAGLSRLRAKTTPPDLFRRILQETAIYLFTEASRNWATAPIEVETPLAPCAGVILAKPIVLVPILRAGLGMADGILRVAPDSGIGHIGLYRDAETLRPVSYYDRLPATITEAQVLLLDPMLATGHSACAAASILKAQGARQIQFLCVVACPPGVQQFHSEHPDVPIVTRCDRSGIERTRLHRARPGRCRRSLLRHRVIKIESGKEERRKGEDDEGSYSPPVFSCVPDFLIPSLEDPVIAFALATFARGSYRTFPPRSVEPGRRIFPSA